jgi:hypothetical protein
VIAWITLGLAAVRARKIQQCRKLALGAPLFTTFRPEKFEIVLEFEHAAAIDRR